MSLSSAKLSEKLTLHVTAHCDNEFHLFTLKQKQTKHNNKKINSPTNFQLPRTINQHKSIKHTNALIICIYALAENMPQVLLYTRRAKLLRVLLHKTWQISKE